MRVLIADDEPLARRALVQLLAGHADVELAPEGAVRAQVRGPLLVVQGVEGVGWDEVARIRLADDEVRNGLVLEVDRDLAVVQVLEGTDGIGPADDAVSFGGSPMRVESSTLCARCLPDRAGG